MEFKEVNVKDVIKEIIDYRGKTPKKLGGDWANAGIRALSAKNIKTGKIVQEDTIRYVNEDLYKKWMKQEVEKGTILITSEAPFGEIYYWDSEEKIVLSQRLFGIKVDKKYNSEFIYYYMTSKKFKKELDARATGSTVTGLRQPELLKCKIEIPEKSNQDKIAKVLRNIDNKIELNNLINDNLLELIKTLYIEKIKNNNDVNFEDKTLDEFCNIFTGKKNANASEENGKYKFFTCAPEPLKINSYIYDGPAVIVAGNGAYTGRTNFYNGKFDLYQRTYGITTNNDYIYLFYAIIYTDLQNDIMGVTHGSAIPYIVMNDIAKFKVKYNKEIFDELSENIKSLLLKIKNNELENETLMNLRDSLLPKIMNGEIDLDKIEI